MNELQHVELPHELQHIETQLARLVPDSDSARDVELLRHFLMSQPVIAPNVTQELAKAKRQSFLLGGILGLCVGAIAMFVMISGFFAEIRGEQVATPIPRMEDLTNHSVMRFATNMQASIDGFPPVQTAASFDVVRQLMPSPLAFWIPFSLAGLSVVFVMLMMRHLRVRFVF